MDKSQNESNKLPEKISNMERKSRLTGLEVLMIVLLIALAIMEVVYELGYITEAVFHIMGLIMLSVLGFVASELSWSRLSDSNIPLGSWAPFMIIGFGAGIGFIFFLITIIGFLDLRLQALLNSSFQAACVTLATIFVVIGTTKTSRNIYQKRKASR